MKVIIAGGRGFKDYGALRDFCDKTLSRQTTVEIVSGTANGADKLGERYAKERGYVLTRFPADWGKFGKGAGHIRNREMAECADALIAFWDGESRGTKHMIDTAKQRGLKVRVFKYK